MRSTGGKFAKAGKLSGCCELAIRAQSGAAPSYGGLRGVNHNILFGEG